MFENILTATDLLEASDGALRCAAELCRRHESRLLVLHVLESPYSGIFRQFVKDFRSNRERVVSREYREQARKALAATCLPVLGPYRNYQLEIVAGIPWIEILRAARRSKAEWIVLGAHGQGAAEKGVARQTGTVGSTVEGVIMGAAPPVLIVNRTLREGQLGFRKIAVCVDFSRSCDHALRFAANLAGAHGSELLLFHLLRIAPSGRISRTARQEQVAVVQRRLQALCGDLPDGIPCRHELREGVHPHCEILNFAAENGVDLIVMGSHTRSHPETWVVGSTVHEVSTGADCLTAVVTHPRLSWKVETQGAPRERAAQLA